MNGSMSVVFESFFVPFLFVFFTLIIYCAASAVLLYSF